MYPVCTRKGRSPEELNRQCEPAAQTTRNWLRHADRDDGRPAAGPTSAHLDELWRLRRENKLVREKRELLKQAAAWFARKGQLEPVQGFEFVKAHQAEHAVATMCRVLGLSPPAATMPGGAGRCRRARRKMC